MLWASQIWGSCQLVLHGPCPHLHPPRDCLLPDPSLTQRRQTPLLISRWKTLSQRSCNWHFSGVNSECFRVIVLSFTGTIFISFVHVSGGLLSFFLPLLYIGCCWKICFPLASLPQPVGSFWNPAVKREFCLRIAKPAFQHHWPNTGSVTIILLRGQTLGGRSCRGLYIQKKVYLLSQCV